MGSGTGGNILAGVTNSANIASNVYTGTGGLVGSPGTGGYTTIAGGTTTFPWQGYSSGISYASGLASPFWVDESMKSKSPAHEKATDKLKRMLGKIL